MSDEHAIYGQYTASVWKWSLHTILVVITTIGLYMVNGYSTSSFNCTAPWLLCYDKNTDKYKCGPAVTLYADVTSTNAGLKSPTQLRTLPNTLLLLLAVGMIYTHCLLYDGIDSR